MKLFWVWTTRSVNFFWPIISESETLLFSWVHTTQSRLGRGGRLGIYVQQRFVSQGRCSSWPPAGSAKISSQLFFLCEILPHLASASCICRCCKWTILRCRFVILQFGHQRNCQKKNATPTDPAKSALFFFFARSFQFRSSRRAPASSRRLWFPCPRSPLRTCRLCRWSRCPVQIRFNYASC